MSDDGSMKTEENLEQKSARSKQKSRPLQRAPAEDDESFGLESSPSPSPAPKVKAEKSPMPDASMPEASQPGKDRRRRRRKHATRSDDATRSEARLKSQPARPRSRSVRASAASAPSRPPVKNPPVSPPVSASSSRKKPDVRRPQPVVNNMPCFLLVAYGLETLFWQGESV